jgi:TonB-dependent starch-binding outer membrane protein SusC
MKKHFAINLIAMLVLLSGIANASTKSSPGQTDPIQVTGSVTDAETDYEIPGVNVVIQGTTEGTITDLDGKYAIEVPNENTVLMFSFVGYESQEVVVGNRTTLNVELQVSATGIEEVVVVGYGTQREKDLTSAIVTIDNEDITKTPTSQAMQSLQGKVAGVQIINSGAPGSGPTVRVRGLGSLPGFGNSDPLYVVDGMFFENIDFLNSSDIKSISVLKDASAAAIYGVRAANGVILIETKTGNYNQDPEIVYNGYYGLQVPQNVLKMSNAEQFAKYVKETGNKAEISFIENAMRRYGRSRKNPNVPAVNTDWYDEVMQNGPITNHSLTINGGANRIKYSVGANYLKQEGLINVIRNEYERFNFRSKIDFRASDRLEAGANINVSNATKYIAPNSIWFNAYRAVPILPVYDDEETANASPEPIANAQNLGYRGTQNPFFTMHYNDDRSKIGNIYSNFYFDYDIIPQKLSFKMTYNMSYGTVNKRNVNFAHNTGQAEVNNSLFRESKTTFNQIWDNILTYQESFGRHNLTVMGGYSFRSEKQEGVFTSASEIQGLEKDNEELWFISGSDRVAVGEINQDNTGDIGGSIYGASYLSRIAYNFDDRYLLYGTFRRDGTNKFQAKWGNFFTVGAGWVISEENFFDLDFVNYLKLRGSWGELGNDAVNPAEGQPTRDAIYFALDDTRTQGITLDNAFDLVTKWETVEETNIGLTGRFLDGSLSLEADVYRRDTKDAVTLLLVPGQRAIIRRSVASIRNSGVEMALNYTRQINSYLSFSIGGNFATLHNEVLDLGPGPGYLDAGSGEFRQRSIEGHPIEAFFGYEVEGVFQNTEEIENSGYTEQYITDFQIEPGDFHFKDQNNDGVVDSEDRVVLGSYLPEITYGMNMNVSYQNFTLSANLQGQAGHKILNRKRGEIIWTTDPNIDADLSTNLWRGDGTSDKYPSAAGLRKGYNQVMSEYYLEDGSYFRIQNVQLSYKLGSRELRGIKTPETTFFVTAERPVTVFSYNGFNPEVANGVDRQTYPIPAVYTVGLNLKF